VEVGGTSSIPRSVYLPHIVSMCESDFVQSMHNRERGSGGKRERNGGGVEKHLDLS
jgi:hypothetical protein